MRTFSLLNLKLMTLIVNVDNHSHCTLLNIYSDTEQLSALFMCGDNCTTCWNS